MESFFYEACKLDEVKAKEMLLRRYSDINYIMAMPAAEFIEFYELAKDKEREERIFTQWVQQMPYMSQDNFVSFADYKDRVTGKNIDTRSTAEMLADIDEIEKKFAKGG